MLGLQLCNPHVAGVVVVVAVNQDQRMLTCTLNPSAKTSLMLCLHHHCEIQLLHFCCVRSEACAHWARALALSWHSETQRVFSVVLFYDHRVPAV